MAVKVQRPGVEESISLDMYLLRRLSGAVRRYLRTNTDLPTLLDEWGESLFRELDYMREARNGTRFRRLFGHLPDVYVPVMREDLTTPRVLVMEWVEGTKLRTANSAAVIRARGGGQAAAVDDSLRLVEVLFLSSPVILCSF